MHKKPSDNWITFNFWRWAINISAKLRLSFFASSGYVAVGRESSQEKRIKSICLSTKGIHVW